MNTVRRCKTQQYPCSGSNATLCAITRRKNLQFLYSSLSMVDLDKWLQIFVYRGSQIVSDPELGLLPVKSFAFTLPVHMGFLECLVSSILPKTYREVNWLFYIPWKLEEPYVDTGRTYKNLYIQQPMTSYLKKNVLWMFHNIKHNYKWIESVMFHSIIN